MRVIVDMPDDLVADLDQEARDSDRSRAWVIRHRCMATYGQMSVGVGPAPGNPATDGAPLPAEVKAGGHSFEPQGRNALKCQVCGGKRANH